MARILRFSLRLVLGILGQQRCVFGTYFDLASPGVTPTGLLPGGELDFTAFRSCRVWEELQDA